jgi:hypothetical protein
MSRLVYTRIMVADIKARGTHSVQYYHIEYVRPVIPYRIVILAIYYNTV